jgi:hypothetical protein
VALFGPTVVKPEKRKSWRMLAAPVLPLFAAFIFLVSPLDRGSNRSQDRYSSHCYIEI